MQPNPVAFWPKSPSKIKINELSCHYTKRADSDEMYDTFNDFDTNKGYGFTLSNETLEGIQSMYVVVDIDNLGGSNNTVLKTRSEITTAIGDINKNVCISDGNEVIETDLVTDSSDGFTFKCDFGEIKKKLKGVLSVSEIFELTVAGNIEKEDKSDDGTTVNIVKESEDLIHELLTESEIDFSLTKETYPLYASPDFQGSSVYAVINYLLSLKDKKLSDNAGTLVAKADRDKIITATFRDEDILEYKQVKSQFDFYNEVTVYGSGLKSTKKDIKSIKQKGRKNIRSFLRRTNNTRRCG